MSLSETGSVSTACKSCGAPLPPHHEGPCPDCGGEAKLYRLQLSGNLTPIGQLSLIKRRDFLEGNPAIHAILIALIFISPLLGYILGGIVGLVLGIALGILNYLLTPLAFLRVREIERIR